MHNCERAAPIGTPVVDRESEEETVNQEPTWDPDELEIHKAAYLSVHQRDPASGKPLTQEKLARRLGTTREQVNRCLQQARERGILRTRYEAPSDEMLDRILLELNYTDVAKVLQDFSELHRESNEGRTIKSVTVVCDQLPCDSEASFDESLLQFGPFTAVKTREFIGKTAKLPSPVIGLAWGRILRCVVDAVSAGDFKGLRGRDRVQCIPLWGEVWGPEVSEWKGGVFTNRDRLSSSVLARDLEEKLIRQEERRRRHSLEAAPIMLPRELSHHREVLFEYLEKVSAWGEVFGRPSRRSAVKQRSGSRPPLAERMQLVLAGAGSPEYPGRFLSPEVLKNVLSDRDTRRLLNAVYGDVGGVLMERPDLSRNDRALLDELDACWTGVKQEHLLRCAENASRRKGVGVVVYAVHKSRALPILEGIRRGIVTHLVTEMGLAAELKQLAQREMKTGRQPDAS